MIIVLTLHVLYYMCGETTCTILHVWRNHMYIHVYIPCLVIVRMLSKFSISDGVHVTLMLCQASIVMVSCLFI